MIKPRSIETRPTRPATEVCRYFTHYGNNGVPGACHEEATLQMLRYPDIRVCEHHASVITFRFPALGDVSTRFIPL